VHLGYTYGVAGNREYYLFLLKLFYPDIFISLQIPDTFRMSNSW